MTDELLNELRELLTAAIKADGGLKGTLQRYDAAKDQLEIVASEGFDQNFLQHFQNVRPFDSSACGRAFGAGMPVMIHNVETDPSFQPHLRMAVAAGFRSVKSVPIFNAQGIKVGVISTHFETAKYYWQTDKLNAILPALAGILDELTHVRGC